MTGDKRRPVVLKLDQEEAQTMYEKAKEKDEGEVVRPTFEMKASDLREELERAWGRWNLTSPED